MVVWEPIPTAMAINAVIIYGILYLVFAAFPVIFINQRYWSKGMSGLAYVGIIIGQTIGVPFYVALDAKYGKKTSGSLAPVCRCRVGPRDAPRAGPVGRRCAI